VSANLPDDLLAKLRELHARGLPISHDDAFFHFGGGMTVRNLCRERLSDRQPGTVSSFPGNAVSDCLTAE
jgi:hypothetical protein